MADTDPALLLARVANRDEAALNALYEMFLPLASRTEPLKSK
jgi:hypothetical protein